MSSTAAAGTRDKSNPWGSSGRGSADGDRNLSTIMKEQEDESQEERNLRLAMEASLQDHNQEEEVDEDLKLAMALSLMETTQVGEPSDKKKEATAVEKDEKVAATPVDPDLELAVALSLKESSQESSDTKNEEATNTAEKDEKAEATAADLSEYVDYFAMLNMGIEKSVVKEAMEREGKDPSILDTNMPPSKDKPYQDALSLELALQLQQEEDLITAQKTTRTSAKTGGGTSHIETINPYEFQLRKKAMSETTPQPRVLYNQDNLPYYEEDKNLSESSQGFRLNSASTWSRQKGSPNTIISPHGEIRTKHDVQLKNISNAERLLHQDDATQVNDAAYNSFQQKMKRYTNKGVLAHHHGKSESYGDKTRGTVLDASTRLQIQKFVNLGCIQKMNGVVNEGKEAVVYHADTNVAIKIFKRITEFRNRGQYVDGDKRYSRQAFKDVDKRGQVELWAEKEYRNLLRANRAKIPTPAPLCHKQNIVFLHFLGQDHWPYPQIRTIDIKYKSSKWSHFYCQTLVYVRKLYHCAHLIHGDLSEFNILICPSVKVLYLEEDDDDEEERQWPKLAPLTEDEDLQVVFIDFGQAVDIGHPAAMELLERDIQHVNSFFADKGGVRVLSQQDALHYVTELEYDKTPEDEEWELTDEEEHCFEEDCVIVDGDVVANAIEKEDGEDDDKGESSTWKHVITRWDDEKDYQFVDSKLQGPK